jgi:hypothetical protein
MDGTDRGESHDFDTDFKDLPVEKPFACRYASNVCGKNRGCRKGFRRGRDSDPPRHTKKSQALKKGFAISVAVVAIVALEILLLPACKSRSQKSSAGGSLARSGYYIEEPSHEDSPKDVNAAIPRIYYFFDRTLSMQGFVAEDYTPYSTIIPQLWNVAESTQLWSQSAADASFYEFGEGDVRKLSRQFVRDNIQRKTFYGNPHEGQIVHWNNSRQVFETAAKYIAAQPAGDSLFIAVTDLYEQNREDNCFSVLFSDAFKRGLSGALIAVESRFNGTIENISINSAPNIEVDGISTFFIFIAGQRDILKKYCEALLQTVEFKQVKSEYVLFLIDNDSRSAKIPWTPDIKNANSERTFERIGYNNNVNLKDDISRLFTWNGDASAPVDALKVESFRLLGNVRSQYIGGISVDYADTKAFSFEPSYTAGYSKGERVEQGAFTTFDTLNDNEKAKFTLTIVDGNEVSGMDASRYPLAIAVGTKNDSLDKGCYQIRYEIFQKAIVPRWVIERSAGNLSELEESNRPNTPVKILRLESIYRYIAEAYNYRPEWGKIYANSLYLEKTR